MGTNLNSSSDSKNNRRWLFILIGILAACFLITACIAVIGAIIYFGIGKSSSININEVPNVAIELSVDDDGCGIVRGDVQGDTPVSSLTWVIQDQDGFSVLERNAENEDQYRYFASGTYTVHIKAWYEGAYHQISDQVTIHCK
ncbi:MAG: hypothetical protein CVU41_14035 [Chloroflexi bacterium HGW-Chloroflexi-3]|nr:MAG: hypothetical protein CVU41_14035 [Chloroflexi bacterium HGW-Chloroflexi-3]